MSYDKIHFVKHRKKFYLLSSVIALVGIVSLFVMGLNLGVDFQSGSRVDVLMGKAFAEQEIVQEMENLGLKGVEVTKAGEQNDRAVINFPVALSQDQINNIKNVFKDKYGIQSEDIQESTVSPAVSRDLAKKALYAILWASLGIVIYVTIRFEYRFAVAAIIALLHDAFFTITLFSLLRVEVNLTFIAAILTIVGYSINDTIVIFDRIRENLKNAKIKRKEDLEEMVDQSIRQTLTRSINTVLTVFVTALALFLFGGEGIKEFSFALVIGLVAGTYSSIFLASQVWMDWKGRDVERKRFPVANNEA